MTARLRVTLTGGPDEIRTVINGTLHSKLRMNADMGSSTFEEKLSEQRAQLDQLVTREHELEVLKELESELEVERISAEVALKAASAKQDLGIGEADARTIARARARKRHLETAFRRGSGEAAPSASELRARIERMRAGRDALEAWLEAPETAAAWRRPRVANTVLVIACAVAAVAAITLHVVYLVLLVPCLMAIAYFTFTAQDADWARLGAVRQFQKTRLNPPAAWDRDGVEARISDLETAASETGRQLEDALAAKDRDSEQDDSAASELAASLELVEANDAYAAALARAGLNENGVNEDLARWLDLVYEIERIDAELAEVRNKRRALSAEIENSRDAVFRFLALEDEAPAKGRADSEALRAGLDRVAKRSL